uniref:Uncharacterized protein n=1 Tax=Parascaris univalens TaxID=6257 RepID=A0A915BDL7_PARUN
QQQVGRKKINVHMLKTVIFVAAVLCNTTLTSTCLKCDYMKSGSQQSGSRICQDTCEGTICYIVVSIYQNETVIAGCLSANDYDAALFKDRNICQRRSQYTVCGCSRTKHCNSPMAYSKLFEFTDKPILEDYPLIPDINASLPHLEEPKLNDRTSITSLTTHEGKIRTANEENFDSSKKIDFLVSTVTSSAEDEYVTGLQNAHEKMALPDETTPLNENKLLTRGIDNMLINEQLNDGMQSKMETTDEDFGFFGPFTSGNRSFRMRIYKIMAVTDPSILADFYAKARTTKNSRNSSSTVSHRRTDHRNARNFRPSGVSFHTANDDTRVVLDKQVNNVNEINGSSLLLLALPIALYIWTKLHW